MSLAPVTTWVAGQVFTAADINAEFASIYNKPITLISPTTGNINFNLYGHTNFVAENVALAPASTASGRLYFNTVTKQMGIDDGAVVRTVPSVKTTDLALGSFVVADAAGAFAPLTGGAGSVVAIGSTGPYFVTGAAGSVLTFGTTGATTATPGTTFISQILSSNTDPLVQDDCYAIWVGYPASTSILQFPTSYAAASTAVNYAATQYGYAFSPQSGAWQLDNLSSQSPNIRPYQLTSEPHGVWHISNQGGGRGWMQIQGASVFTTNNPTLVFRAKTFGNTMSRYNIGCYSTTASLPGGTGSPTSDTVGFGFILVTTSNSHFTAPSTAAATQSIDLGVTATAAHTYSVTVSTTGMTVFLDGVSKGTITSAAVSTGALTMTITYFATIATSSGILLDYFSLASTATTRW